MILATHRGEELEYTEYAPNPNAAERQARERARLDGRKRITIVAVEQDLPVRSRRGGAALTAEQVAAEIELMIGEVGLEAVNANGEITLLDPNIGPLVLGDSPSAALVTLALYEYSVATGQTNENFDDWVRYNLDLPTEPEV